MMNIVSAYLAREMNMRCKIETEQARTSQVWYNTHQDTDKGQASGATCFSQDYQPPV